MAIKLKTLNDPEGKLDELEIPFGKEKLTIWYNRVEFTPKLERELKELAANNMYGNLFSQMLLKLVRKWDVVDGTTGGPSKTRSCCGAR